MKNWESVLAGPDRSMKEIIEILNRSAQRIVVIVDDNKKVLGTITDGDIRRNLLQFNDLSMPANKVMCHSHTLANMSLDKKEILALLERTNLLQTPIVNDNNQIIGVETIYDLIKKTVYENPVVLF